MLYKSGRIYYVHNNGHAVFVKEAEWYELQGGHTQPWGKEWRPIRASSIEHAYKKAETIV